MRKSSTMLQTYSVYKCTQKRKNSLTVLIGNTNSIMDAQSK